MSAGKMLAVQVAIYNTIENVAFTSLEEERRLFRKYNELAERRFRRFKSLQQNGSLKYFHSESLIDNVFEPLFLEKTAGDLDFWIVEIRKIILDMIDKLLAFSERNIPEEKISSEYIKVVNDIIKDIPDRYTIRKQFMEQGPKNIRLDDDRATYYKKDWYDGFETGKKVLESTLENVQSLDLSLNLIKTHLKKNGKPEQGYTSDVNYSEILSSSNKMETILFARTREMMLFSLNRFANVMDVLNNVIKDMEKGERLG